MESGLEEFEELIKDSLQEYQKENNIEKVTLWRVQLWPMEDSKPRKTVLKKFLRARNGDLHAAKAQLMKTLAWRSEMKIEEECFLEETFPPAFDPLGLLHGKDKEVYGDMDTSAVFPDSSTTQFIRWRLQLMESSLALLDFEENETCTQVHDYAGATMLSFNPTVKKASRELISIFQDYYPETLKRKYFIHIPSFFETIYGLISPLIDEQTRNKFILCSSSYRRQLFEHIDPYQVPPRYGGFLHEADGNPLGEEENMTKVEIKAGKREQIEIDVNENQTITWEFVVLDKDIEFVVTLNGQVVERKRNDTDFGSFSSKSAGKISVILSNEYSLWNKKIVWYHINRI